MQRYLTSPSRAEREIIGTDTRRLVTDTTVAPFRYIVNLEFDGEPWCSGTLIGPRTVLTAAHCLFRAGPLDPTRMRVIPGRNGTLEPLPATMGVGLRLAPGYTDRALHTGTPVDFGVLYLRDPIGDTIGVWTRAHSRRPPDTIGTSISAAPLPQALGVLKVNLSGYPGDKCIPLGGTPPRTLCGAQQWRSFDNTVGVGTKPGMLEYLNDTFGGHSGSPVWVRRDPSLGGRVMVGIHVDRDDPTTPVVANRAVRFTPAILAQIDAWLASAPSGPGPAPGPRPTLRRGSTGPNVVDLQRRLNTWRAGRGGPGAPLVLDGIFGPLTENMVRSFQLANGLAADGIVGPLTWSALLTVAP